MNIIANIESKIKYLIQSIHMCARGQDFLAYQPVLEEILYAQLKSAIPAGRLEHSEYSLYSQNGEDGIIGEIFSRIGTTSKTFVEFGVGDGMQNNTRFLLQQGDWHGLWIEGSHEFCEQIRQNCDLYIQTGRLQLTESFITKDNIDSLISKAFVGEIDLLSIDIDGNDLHVWQAIKSVKPRVLITEYNPSFPPPAKVVMPYKADHVWEERTDYYGASLSAWAEQLNTDGYTLVGCELSGTNAFWVRNDLVADKFNYDKNVATHYHPARHTLFAQMRRGHHASPLKWQSSACGI